MAINPIAYVSKDHTGSYLAIVALDGFHGDKTVIAACVSYDLAVQAIIEDGRVNEEHMLCAMPPSL